ncbi:hypothetical protein SPWS13_1078 [Shewanella putrefaciens]|nr:hypothetical protein SPWS13_1078 [Shewanella putrefaciens]
MMFHISIAYSYGFYLATEGISCASFYHFSIIPITLNI